MKISANVLNVRYNTMLAMSQLDLNDASMNIHRKRKDALSDAVKKSVHDFYLKPSISTEQPGKKTVSKKKLGSSYMYYNPACNKHTNSSKNRSVTPSGFLILAVPVHLCY
ncbi:hypothetical protein LSH36_434g01040 [Paralvinella palmiformis]|uniref:Uncharacterized protein n=1 Tax=Paralvinella palmiformis TaxID=53620 RepID=A0AAD9JBM8_9ANNE|nr:hypothetical protein LSH36_434g01040 [Paralvinella palmiformis]